MAAIYRNRNNGEVLRDPDADLVADLANRPNWFEVSEEDAGKRLDIWEAGLDRPTVDPADVFPAGFVRYDGLPSAVDVPQSGPTGSKSVQAVAAVPESLPKGAGKAGATVADAGPIANPDGKQGDKAEAEGKPVAPASTKAK